MRIIAGQWKRHLLQYPGISSTRPTTDRLRETMFNILTAYFFRQNRSFSHLKVADLFAGSGALGLEALSRGVEHVTFFEKNPQAGRILQNNILKLQAQSQSTLIVGDVFKTYISSQGYDLVLLDPPYSQNLVEKTLDLLDQKNLLNRNALIMAETQSTEEIIFNRSWQCEDHRTVSNSSLWLLKYIK